MNNTILVTGAAGFIGSHLVELLIESGYFVKAFDRYNSNSDRGWLSNFNHPNFEFIHGDIRDYDSVNKSVQDSEFVIHLAALIGIPYSYDSPLAYIRTNIEGTYNVLEASRNHSVRKVLVTSTSETYGSAQYVPIDEGHPLVGQSPYSASKIAADQLSLSYYKSFGLPLTIVRPFNTYGPRQSMRAVIPTIINQCLSQDSSIKLGSLHPTRDLTYVGDTCMGFLKILHSVNTEGEIINIGTNNEISIGDLVQMIMKLTKVSKPLEIDDKRIRPKPSEVDRLLCNNDKLVELVNWSPVTSLESGLVTTIKWYENNSQLDSSKYYI